MLAYAFRRIAVSVPVLAGILIVAFFLVRLMPGDPIRALADPNQIFASPEYIARRRAELGLDDSIITQFVAWIRELIQGNLGYSFARDLPVVHMIAERIGHTALLVIPAIAVALPVGVFVGVMSALKRSSWFDYLSAVLSMIAISVPNFFLGLVAIYVFSVKLGIFPTGGTRTLSGSSMPMIDAARHMMMPVGIMALTLVGPYVRFVRQGMLENLQQDYVTTARAKGVQSPNVVIHHVLRNSLIPLVTLIALQIPSLITGVLIIEVIFSWPGIGRLVFEAVEARDYPVLIAATLLSGIFVLFCNLLADLVTAVLDPRIRI